MLMAEKKVVVSENGETDVGAMKRSVALVVIAKNHRRGAD
jgi:hypothetical protein